MSLNWADIEFGVNVPRLCSSCTNAALHSSGPWCRLFDEDASDVEYALLCDAFTPNPHPLTLDQDEEVADDVRPEHGR